MQEATKNVVLSYPYEGGLYYLFSRENPSGPPNPEYYPYYDALYGPIPKEAQYHAVNLLTLFDEVVLPFADEYLPQHQKYSNNGNYYHPDLRIRVAFDSDSSKIASELAPKLLLEPEIASIFETSPLLPKDWNKMKFVVARTIEQLRLAVEQDAVIVGGESIGALVAQLWHSIGCHISPIGSLQPKTIGFGDDTFKLTSLDWRCEDVESLNNIRNSEEISQYAQSFREAVFTAEQKGNLKEELLNLMRRAMQSEEVATKAKGAFEVAGLVTTGFGLIPFLGTGAAIANFADYLAYKQAERQENAARWYLLGNKMREVDLRAILRKSPI